MFDGISTQRLLGMSVPERRWLHNVKKAFHASDSAYQEGHPQDKCFPELCNAIDTAKTLRRSLRGEDTSPTQNKQRFVDFINLEVPTPASGGLRVRLIDSRTKKSIAYSFADLLYAIRCMVHEAENLNVEEKPDYHILLDWSNRNRSYFGEVDASSGQLICNGHALWWRAREILAKFITGIDGRVAYGRGEGFSISIDPPLGSIRPRS
ncbi:MAG: hypothetical protein KKI02_04150 [Planctomycetes bacterium]|nr:hypothetical protein [Planctomycetota bacterium]